MKKFRLSQLELTSSAANRSGLQTVNMTSATPNKINGSTRKNVIVDENGEIMVDDLSAGGSSGILPIMNIDPSTTATNIGSTTVTGTGVILNNGGASIATMGFVIYPSGNASTIIGGLGVTNFPVTPVVQNGNIIANITGLTANTNYCMKPYAINSIGTSYGDEVCFTTSDTFLWISGSQGGRDNILKSNKNNGALVTSYTSPTGWNGATSLFDLGGGEILVLDGPSAGGGYNKYNINTNSWSGLVTIGGQPRQAVLVGNELISAGQFDNTVYKTNITTGLQTGSFFCGAGNGPQVICTDGTNVYVGCISNIKKLDIATLTQQWSVALGGQCYGIGYHSGFVYANAYTGAPGTYKLLDSTGATSASIAGGNPGCLFVDASGVYIYDISGAPAAIKKFDLNLAGILGTNAYAMSNTLSRIKIIGSDLYALTGFGGAGDYRKINPSTMATIWTSASSGYNGPMDILFI